MGEGENLMEVTDYRRENLFLLEGMEDEEDMMLEDVFGGIFFLSPLYYF